MGANKYRRCLTKSTPQVVSTKYQGLYTPGMTSDPSNRAITNADIEAARRLKALWKQRAKDRGLTQYSMAEKIGRTQGLVSNYLNGVIALNYKALMQFCAALGIDDPTIVRNDLPEQRIINRVSEQAATYGEWADVEAYLQSASLGDGSVPEEYAETHKLKFRADSLRRQGLKPEKLRVFYGKGDSMLPRIQDGDAVLCDTADTSPEDGRLYAIERDGELFVKRCDIIDRIVYFRSDNAAGDHSWKKPKRYDDPLQPIRILGRVRWIGSWE